MAFQAGTRVDPRLMQADYSGFARAAQINAQAMANLGAQIGEGIQNYQKNKQITASSLAQLEAISSARPEAYAALRESGGDVSKSISNIEKGDYKQKDVLATLGALNAYVSSQDAQQQSRIRAAQLEKLEAKALPFEPRTRVIDGVTYVETKAGEFEPLKKDKGLTPGDVTALSKLMERPEFENIKFDETTGAAYMEVPNEKTLNPFDKKRAAVPQEIQQLPGFEEFSRMRRTATAPRDYAQMGMRTVE